MVVDVYAQEKMKALWAIRVICKIRLVTSGARRPEKESNVDFVGDVEASELPCCSCREEGEAKAGGSGPKDG